MSNLPSTPVVIDVLGGPKKVAAFLKTSQGVVSNWKSTGKFPAHSYPAIQKKLAKMGFAAPDSLWAVTKPRREIRRAKRKAKRVFHD